MSEIATYEPTKAEIQTVKTDFANAAIPVRGPGAIVGHESGRGWDLF